MQYTTGRNPSSLSGTLILIVILCKYLSANITHYCVKSWLSPSIYA